MVRERGLAGRNKKVRQPGRDIKRKEELDSEVGHEHHKLGRKGRMVRLDAVRPKQVHGYIGKPNDQRVDSERQGSGERVGRT